MEFLKKSTLCATKTISFLWPLDYLHGVERFEKIYDNGINNFFLKTVFVFVRRLLFDIRYRPDGLIPTGATSFAWFHFCYKLNYGQPKCPQIEWLHNNEHMGVPTEREQIFPL